MNASIYKHEFRGRLKSVIIWSVAIAALILFFFSIFPIFADQAALMDQFLAKYPAELRVALGLGNLDLATVLGYYSFLFLFVQLCLAVQAANYGVGLVSVEETDLTADFLLTKPVSRAQVMTSKLLAALTSLLITDAVIVAASLIGIAAFREGRPYSTGPLLLLLFSMIIFQLFFLGVGLAISLLVRRVRSVTPYALGLAMGMYVLSAFSGVFGDVALEYVTPFKHLDAAYIIHNAAYDTPLVLLDAAVTIVALVASYWLYVRRDIPAVS
jgi:ABC-2 type transport system permease protein